MIRCKGQGCRLWARVEDGPLCERCRRLTAIGAIVELVFWHGAQRNVPEGAVMPVRFVERLQVLRLTRPLDAWQQEALDAVASLLTDHAVLRRRHRRELAEEQRDAQRGAAESFASGMLEGMDQRNRG